MENSISNLKGLKYLAVAGTIAGFILLGVYGGTTTVESMSGKNPESVMEFVSRASSFAPIKKSSQSKKKPARQTVKPAVVRPRRPVKISNGERERMANVANYINQNRRHGIKSAVYNPKKNTVNIRFNRKKPTALQQRYARFLLKSLNAE